MGVNGIYGLSGSGMDIESMVKVGMMSRQNEYDKMAQKFTKNEWLKADYIELNSKITTFNSSTLSQYKMSTTMNARSAESSSSAVKVTATSNAMLMNHKVDVVSLSSNAYLISTADKLTRYNGNDAVDANSTSIELKNILFRSLSIDPSTKKASYRAMNAPNEDVYGVYNVDLTDANKNKAISFFISDGATKEKNADGTESKTLKNVEISFTFEEINDGATLNDLVSKINSAGLNIRASYDAVNDKFSLYNTTGGADNKISITVGKDSFSDDGPANVSVAGTIAKRFLNSLQLYQSKDGELYAPSTLLDTDNSVADLTKDAGGSAMKFIVNTTTEARGMNGIIKVDGLEYTTTENKATVGGITYTALNTTGTTDSNGVFQSSGAATVSVSQDTDAIIDKVKSFITDYNKLLADLYKKYDEKPNSDYKPLTQSQKDQMKDEQIEKWEEKAKAGLLYHDQTLGKIIMDMRDAVAESVEGIDSKYNSLFSLGVSTTGIKGQLNLDEDKLKAALAEDPDAVYNVFAKLDSKDLDNSAKSGVAQRLGDIFVNANKSIKERAGSSADITEDSDLNNLLRNLQTKMSNFKRLMSSFEDALYKKYDAMESTLAQLGTQLNYIMGSTGQ